MVSCSFQTCSSYEKIYCLHVKVLMMKLRTLLSQRSFKQSAVQGLWPCIFPLTSPTSKKSYTDSNLMKRKPRSLTYYSMDQYLSFWEPISTEMYPSFIAKHSHCDVYFSSMTPSRCQFTKFSLLGHFDPWWWNHYVLSKCWEPTIQWHGILSQKSGNHSYTSAKT